MKLDAIIVLAILILACISMLNGTIFDPYHISGYVVAFLEWMGF